MKHSRATIIFLALVSWFHPAFGQLAPLQLQVIKANKQVTNPRASYSAYDNTLVRTTDDVLTFYTIELSRALTPLSDVRVRWAILVQQQNPGRLKLVQGESVCNLPIGGTVRLQTQAVRTGVVIHSQTPGFYDGGTESVTPHQTARIRGYEVEVYVNGQRVIAEVEPPEVQQEIEAAKKKTKAPPKPNSMPNVP